MDIQDIQERGRLFNHNVHSEMIAKLRKEKPTLHAVESGNGSNQQLQTPNVSSLMDAEFFKAQPAVRARTVGKSAVADFNRATLLPTVKAPAATQKEAMQEKKNSKKHYKRTQKKKVIKLTGDVEAREFL
jgi:hypothetical protein